MVSENLYWVPNTAGLFSHFLQLKIMYSRYSEYAKHLVVVPTKSHHYGDRFIDMCGIFRLPKVVSCGLLPNTLHCTDSVLNLMENASAKGSVCYDGKITFGSELKGRHFVLRAVDISMSLLFSKNYTRLARYFQTALESLSNITRGGNFTVVHWRRGDQLGRCSSLVDVSVNCRNATALLHKVRLHSKDSVVYVATNEPQQSPEMRQLRSAGFTTFTEVAASNALLFGGMDAFQVIATEAILMLHASTFLAWGVSEINDVVEHERSLAGRRHCIAQPAPAKEVQENWCTLNGKIN